MDKRTWGNVFLFFSFVFLCVLAYMYTHSAELKIWVPLASKRFILELACFILFLLIGLALRFSARKGKRRRG